MGEQLECLWLCLGIGDVPIELLWLRIRDGLCHMDDSVVGVCCRPPDQEEQVERCF